ncbi:hypothetical protein Taro_029107 [Colocasia esculenta]|uniref:Uncharacterized protein n=1 Tax=Colocasia esculenta TaxID=4460 RepID=A0A843VI51_COLES|nr:hypothetical protein [Colocasia esculenta]
MANSARVHQRSNRRTVGLSVFWNFLKLFTHFCLGSVDTRSKQVDTSPRFQKTQLLDWDNRFQKGRSTLVQGRSTLDPVSSRPVCRNETAGRH